MCPFSSGAEFTLTMSKLLLLKTAPYERNGRLIVQVAKHRLISPEGVSSPFNQFP